jgi:hypothetical protein
MERFFNINRNLNYTKSIPIINYFQNNLRFIFLLNLKNIE